MAARTKAAAAKPARLTPTQKLRAKKAVDAAKLKIKSQRDKVKVLVTKLKAEEKVLNALLPEKPRPATNHVAGVARAAKKASETVEVQPVLAPKRGVVNKIRVKIETVGTVPVGTPRVVAAAKKRADNLTGAKRTAAPAVTDRTVKPLEFIDGLCSIETYLIVSHKSSDKSIKLGVRFTGGDYRMHFYPNIAAHGGGRNGKMRDEEGYETIWVNKITFAMIADRLRTRDDTHNLPQELVEKLVRARDTKQAQTVLASLG